MNKRVSLFESNPTQVYRQHANRLRNIGLWPHARAAPATAARH
ncbi:hypothetical protein IHMA87_05297 [Pseudomonas paraeruginosa]|nr:hypothetical protein IHMA87_05297 [Pseudomonas aeruginosa]VFT36277.1 lipase LipC [Pseudomonas aeruginosa]